jgi:membrane protein
VVIDQARELGEDATRSVPAQVVRKFAADRGPNHAILIAWNILFAIFPIVLAVAAIGGVLLGAAGVTRQDIEAALLSALPESAGGHEAMRALNEVQRNSGLLAVLALAGFFWSASNLFGTLEYSLGEILRAGQRPFLMQKLMSLVMMLIFIVLAPLGVGTAALLAVLSNLPLPPAFLLTHGAQLTVLQTLFTVIAGFLLFFGIYYVVPARRQHAVEVLPGAAFAGVAFVLLTQLFPLYIHFSGGFNQYGSVFALIFVLLTFLYFLGLVTVLGAELNSVLHPEPRPYPKPGPAPAPTKGPRRRRLYGLMGAVLELVLAVRSRGER